MNSGRRTLPHPEEETQTVEDQEGKAPGRPLATTFAASVATPQVCGESGGAGALTQLTQEE